MMPTIRVDDEVFERLQRDAKPFVDTPNSVLRALLNLDEPPPSSSEGRQPQPGGGNGPTGGRLRRDATGLGDEERYVRGMVATIRVDGAVYKRSGVRSPRGADLNQIQTWVAEVVGSRHSGNATLIHNLRAGSRRESVGNVEVVLEPQAV